MPGFLGKCDVSLLIIFGIIQLQLSSFISRSETYSFLSPLPVSSSVQRGHEFES